MEVREYLIDSDILIDYLRGFEKARVFLIKENRRRILYISAINVMEVYSGKDAIKFKYQKLLNEFLSSFKIIELNERIAKMAGLIHIKYNTPFADAAIAATALEYNLILITRNIKHFKEIKKLKIIQPY